MGYIEEPISVVERYIGRRLPLAILTLGVIAGLAYLGKDMSASFLGGAFMIIMKGYYDDVRSENAMQLPHEYTLVAKE